MLVGLTAERADAHVARADAASVELAVHGDGAGADPCCHEDLSCVWKLVMAAPDIGAAPDTPGDGRLALEPVIHRSLHLRTDPPPPRT
ncbi:hypothetical protein Salmuc_02502 [Salipiger mucosus DSM 16094]|uniref:Uncharacterized protein n=1 Tax=Salipiger mucosus DSM 16094 TaxID=1123237 RepID=S9QR91_9RHOB|nr:hypothetical protein Salmuc_02502 [Salipiger mucosus DSM 16094]